MSLDTNRKSLLSIAANREYDVVVVGGGVTGACAAWDAATRGLRVLLLERADFGAATSAHSLKILHGGIRYLQHLDFRRLRESCRERSAFLRMAPHLTAPKPFVVPTYGYGLQGKNVFRAAFLLLRMLTMDRNRHIADDAQKIPDGHTLSRGEVLRRFPDVNPEGLTGAAVFYDGVILNPPRLVFEIVQTAVEAGAIAVNYCNVTDICTSEGDGAVAAVRASDVASGESFEFHTRSVINAAGPYAPWLGRERQDALVKTPFSRDMAFVVDRVNDDPAALAVQTRYKDPDAILTRGNRHLFMVPWRDYTLIGVNSRVFEDHPDSLTVTDAEIADFLDEINEACPQLGLSRPDIRAVNAGLLPFGDNEEGSRHLSFGKRSLVRDHGAEGGPAGLVTAISIRWTMGRATAQSAVDSVARFLTGRTGTCLTTTLGLRGCVPAGRASLASDIRADARLSGLQDRYVDSVMMNYGSNWNVLGQLATEDPAMLEPVGETSTLRGQVLIAARDELVTNLADIVLRRTDLGSGEQPTDEVLAECAAIAARPLDWSEQRVQAEIDSVKRLYPFYRIPPAGVRQETQS